MKNAKNETLYVLHQIIVNLICEFKLEMVCGHVFAFPIMENDVILVPALFHDLFKDSRKAYDELMNEMNYDDFYAMAWQQTIGRNTLDYE